MPEMTIKEWVAEYRLINETEREMLKYELPLIPPGEGAMRYFHLCEFLTRISSDAREIFADERRERYIILETRLRRIAEYLRHDISS